jgi:zinc protease
VKISHIAAGVALLTLPMISQAQAKLTAEQILEKNIAASGGRAAFDKIKTTTMKGTLNVKSNGIKGTIEITAKSPDKVLVNSTLPGVGVMQQGYDGKTGWSQDPFTGLRKLEGAELEALKRQAQFNEQLNYKSFYTKVSLIGKQKLNGKEVYALKMIPKTGKPSTSYFDAKTFLLIKQDMVTESPQGTFPVESLISEYKTIDGVKFPTVMQQKVGNVAEMEMRFTDITNNTPVEDKIFAMPAK